jgi:hypothetical protein
MRRRLFHILLLALLMCLGLLVAPFGIWWRLQSLGEVPEHASYPMNRDWQWAQLTTWWGKPLDPIEFWKGRTIWADDSANHLAHRHGRGYPPVPIHVTNLIVGFPLSSRSQADFVSTSGGPDSGPLISFHGTDAESAYWVWFWRTKPKPPGTLEREQIDLANDIFSMRGPLFVGGGDIHASIPAGERINSEEVQKSRAREIGLPMECLGEDALFWTYVLRKRQEYAQLKQESANRNTTDDYFVKHFLERLAVEARFITEPLTEEQLKTANAWKIAYLQRLRRENVDESYINSYLKAWNLPSTELSAESNLP